MTNTNWLSIFLDDDMRMVLEPERGYFSVETIKQWAIDTLFIYEGVIEDDLTITEAIRILHKHGVAKIRSAKAQQRILDSFLTSSESEV